MRTHRALLLCLALLGLSAAGAAQNLLANAAFDANLAAWQLPGNPAVTSTWSGVDVASSTASGSASLVASFATAQTGSPALTQCVNLAGGLTYRIGFHVLYSAAAVPTDQVSVSVFWSDLPGCGGNLSSAFLAIPRGSSSGWVSQTLDVSAPGAATSALVQFQIYKEAAGGSLTAYLDDVSLAPVGAAPEVLVGYLPVASSTPGALGSFFKTSVQLLNPNFSAISGHLVFHPAGVSASVSDPTIGFSLAAGQTTFWADVVAAMGSAGIGSIDVYSSDGANAPIALTRIFNDAGPGGTSGFTEPLVKTSDVQGGLGVSVTGFLIGPYDTAAFRYNIGIRTLDAPVSVTAVVKDASGSAVASITRSYPANYFEQRSSVDFLGGFVLGNGQSIQITFSGGGLIVYGATVDNITQDPSAQLMPYVYAIA